MSYTLVLATTAAVITPIETPDAVWTCSSRNSSLPSLKARLLTKEVNMAPAMLLQRAVRLAITLEANRKQNEMVKREGIEQRPIEASRWEGFVMNWESGSTSVP